MFVLAIGGNESLKQVVSLMVFMSIQVESCLCWYYISKITGTFVIYKQVMNRILVDQMLKDSFNLVIVIFIILIASLYRALIMPGSESITANFSPLWGIALFAGAQISSVTLRYIIPLLIIFLSDIFLNMISSYENGSALFYSGWTWVYSSIIVAVYIGSLLSQKLTILWILCGAISVSVCQWLMSDLGYFLSGGINILTQKPYPSDLSGLFECFAMGFPFFKKTLAATIFFSLLFFYSHKALQQIIGKLSSKLETSNQKIKFRGFLKNFTYGFSKTILLNYHF